MTVQVSPPRLGPGEITIGDVNGSRRENLDDLLTDRLADEEIVLDAAAAAAATAATDAVDAEIQGRDILEGGDISPYNDDVAFTVVDSEHGRSWLEIADDGGPTAHAASVLVETVASPVAESIGFSDYDSEVSGLGFAVVDIAGKRSWIEAKEDGRPSDWALQCISEGLSGISLDSIVPMYPSDDWAHWGDSLTAGGFPAQLAILTGQDHYNGGIGGQDTAQIAARQGGVPVRLTLTGDEIPASGSVAVTAIATDLVGTSIIGSIADVDGTLSVSGSDWTFTRAIAGDAVDVPPGTFFIPADARTYRNRTVTLWTGRNGFKTSPIIHITSGIRAMIDFLSPSVKRAIVMEILPWVGEETGTGDRVTLDALNAAIAAAFPTHYLDIATWLRTADAETASGVTFTTDDDTDIANGLTPRSLRADAGHPNAAGYLAIATRVYEEAQTRGWL